MWSTGPTAPTASPLVVPSQVPRLRAAVCTGAPLPPQLAHSVVSILPSYSLTYLPAHAAVHVSQAPPPLPFMGTHFPPFCCMCVTGPTAPQLLRVDVAFSSKGPHPFSPVSDVLGRTAHIELVSAHRIPKRTLVLCGNTTIDAGRPTRSLLAIVHWISTV